MNPPSPEDIQSVEMLKSRYDELNTKKITAEANLQTSRGALDKLKKEAREKHGTDDLEVLRKKLQDMKDENERKRAEYQEHLDSIERELATVERDHAEAARNEPEL